MNDAVPPAAEAPASNIAEERSRLLDIVKGSADNNRNYFLAWLGFALYVLVTVAGTSDTQLLLPDIGVSLPVVGVQMPLFSFYLAAPLFVIAVHFNLLQNLDSHAYKLDKWRGSWDGQPPRDELQAFLFDFALLERGGAFEVPVRIASDILFYWLGPIVLLAILLRFSDDQQAGYTAYHFVALLAGLIIALRAHGRLPLAPLRIGKSRRDYRRPFQFLVAAAIACIALPTVWLTWALEDDNPGAHAFMAAVSGWGPPGGFLQELLLPRLVLTPGSLLPGPDAQTELKAKTEAITVDDWWRDQGHGVDLQGRNLRYASFSGVDLRKANLSEARLASATFQDVHLQGVNFQGALLPAVVFIHSQARGADFLMTDLRAAWFIRTDLTAASLLQTNLAGAWISQSTLTGADVRGTSLYGAALQDIVDPPLDAMQRGQLLSLKSQESRTEDDKWSVLAKQMPTIEAVDRLQRARSSRQQQPTDVDFLMMDPSTRDADLRMASHQWCSSGPSGVFVPYMVDRLLSGWPGIDAVYQPTPAQKDQADKMRNAFFMALITSESCAPRKAYICGRLATQRSRLREPLWPDVRRACGVSN